MPAEAGKRNKRTAIDQVLDMIVPAGCALCGQRLPRARICPPCYSELPWIRSACPICARPVQASCDSDTSDDLPCGACQRERSPVTRIVAPLAYRFPVDSMIKSLKFRQQTWLAPVLAELAATAWVERGLDADVIVPVPLNRWRHAVRGYNQAAELAGQIGKYLGKPRFDLLRRPRATAPQTGLDRDARRKNLTGAFAVARRPVAGSVLLIDDVVTTGETVRAAASALHAAGVDVVGVLAVARAL